MLLGDIATGGAGLDAGAGLEAEVAAVAFAAAAVAIRLELCLIFLGAVPNAVVENRLVELDDEVAAEVLAVVDEALVVDPTRHLPLFGIDAELAHLGIAVDDEEGILAFGVGEAQMHAALRRGHLGTDAVVEGDAVVVRMSLFLAVAEGGAALVWIDFQFAGLGEESIDGVVADPGRALVALPESADLVGVVEVLEALTVRPRLRRPHVLGVGHGGGGERVAVGETEVGVRTLQRIDVLHEVRLPASGKAGQEA